MMSKKTANIFLKAALYMVLILFAVLMCFPFVWMLSTSLKEPQDVFKVPAEWIPDPFVFGNYRDIFYEVPLGLGYFNSLKVAISACLGTLATCSLAGYAFSKLAFKGKGIMFATLLSTMMIPSQVTLIPMYIVFKNLGWIDTHLPLIVPAIFCNAFGVFLCRQFFYSIPDSIIEAAKIDGCSQPSIFLRIMAPQSKGMYMTVGLFSFLGNWNSFMTPLIYLNSTKNFTLPLLLSVFKGNDYTTHTEWPLLMAASCISIVPVLLLYAFTQKHYVKSIVLTGMKA
jgi:multiple sugar transport system permease protein